MFSKDIASDTALPPLLISYSSGRQLRCAHALAPSKVGKDRIGQSSSYTTNLLDVSIAFAPAAVSRQRDAGHVLRRSCHTVNHKVIR